MKNRPRVVSAAFALAGLAGCSGSGDAELTYPPAPPQQLPDSGRDGLVDPGWVVEIADHTGIPARAVAAYANASLALAESDPECGIGWNTLAGIGATESKHGSHDGAHLGDDGVVSPAIIGIALDGSAGVAAVYDTDGGLYDGDAVWDRAVGPMQFIPESWLYYGQDANGDGVADPQQIDDAALAAGTLLCHRGGDVTSDDGWSAAVAAYNASLDYINVVAQRAEEFAD
ncbi:MAG: lytic transglycosylase domain-containing protein [Ancrocorticia sp.]